MSVKVISAQIAAMYLLTLAAQADTQTPLAVVRFNPAALESPSVTRYLNHGQYRFCLERNSPGLISMVVEDSRGNRVASAGEPICAQLAPTPDGSNLRWKSLVDLTATASYLNNSTYINAPSSGNPVCNANLRWIPIDLARNKALKRRNSENFY